MFSDNLIRNNLKNYSNFWEDKELSFFSNSEEGRTFLKHMEERILDVQNLLKGNEKMTMVIGAGVSCSAGLPGWDTLISRLLNLMISDEFIRSDAYHTSDKKLPYIDLSKKQKVINVFSSTDVLETAEYVFGPLTDEEEENIVALAAQGKFGDAYLKELVRLSLMPDYNKRISINNIKGTTVDAISNLAKKYFTVNCGMGVEPRKRSILNYNFDDLLETCIRYNSEIKCQVITKRDLTNINADISVFHPHGYIKVADIDSNDEESEKLILAESHYYALEEKPYSWQNYIVARALNNSNCIFFGFSGNDHNFKRILKNSEDGIPDPYKRYMFVTINDILKNLGIKTNSQLRPNTTKIDKLFSCLALKEKYWIKKGFIPIWTTYADLPLMINGFCN